MKTGNYYRCMSLLNHEGYEGDENLPKEWQPALQYLTEHMKSKEEAIKPTFNNTKTAQFTEFIQVASDAISKHGLNLNLIQYLRANLSSHIVHAIIFTNSDPHTSATILALSYLKSHQGFSRIALDNAR